MERQLRDHCAIWVLTPFAPATIRRSQNCLSYAIEWGSVVWDECFDKWNETADRVDGHPSHEEHAERHLRA